MLRIGEFSVLSAISINMLRHYDKIGLLVPEHVDVMSGYRYYDKEQLIQANRIVAHKAMGFSLDEIKTAQSMTQQEMECLLQNKLNSKYEELAAIQNQIQKVKEAIQTDGKGEDYALSIVTKIIPDLWVVGYRQSISDFPQEGMLWKTMMEECEKQGIKISSSAIAMAITHEMNDEKSHMEVEVQLSIEKSQKCSGKINIYNVPQRKVASVIFQGSYAKISLINSYLAKWLENNQYEISGKTFTIYHNSPRESKTEEYFITELCFPISKKKIDSHII